MKRLPRKSRAHLTLLGPFDPPPKIKDPEYLEYPVPGEYESDLILTPSWFALAFALGAFVFFVLSLFLTRL